MARFQRLVRFLHAIVNNIYHLKKGETDMKHVSILIQAILIYLLIAIMYFTPLWWFNGFKGMILGILMGLFMICNWNR